MTGCFAEHVCNPREEILVLPEIEIFLHVLRQVNVSCIMYRHCSWVH